MKCLNHFFVFLAAFSLSACGKAQVVGNTDPTGDLSVPVLATGSDIYVEIGEEFSNQISGQVDITNLQVFGTAAWPALSSLQLELRASLTGSAGTGNVVVLSAQPASWAGAVPVLNVTIPAGSTSYKLVSNDLHAVAPQLLEQGKFWVLGRVRYAGLDLTSSLKLKGLYAHAEGEKSLAGLAPLLNLSF